MRLERSRRAEAIIPTASMADIAFLLIIFFMVTTAYEVDRTQVRLPLSHTRAESHKGAAVVVIAREPGSAVASYRFSDGRRTSRAVLTPSDIYLEASRITYGEPGRPFVVKADATLRYGLVEEVLDQLRAAGVVNLVLLTQQKGAEGHS